MLVLLNPLSLQHNEWTEEEIQELGAEASWAFGTIRFFFRYPHLLLFMLYHGATWHGMSEA
jgi:hypothetical protein